MTLMVFHDIRGGGGRRIKGIILFVWRLLTSECENENLLDLKAPENSLRCLKETFSTYVSESDFFPCYFLIKPLKQVVYISPSFSISVKAMEDKTVWPTYVTFFLIFGKT